MLDARWNRNDSFVIKHTYGLCSVHFCHRIEAFAIKFSIPIYETRRIVVDAIKIITRAFEDTLNRWRDKGSITDPFKRRIEIDRSTRLGNHKPVTLNELQLFLVLIDSDGSITRSLSGALVTNFLKIVALEFWLLTDLLTRLIARHRLIHDRLANGSIVSSRFNSNLFNCSANRRNLSFRVFYLYFYYE